MWPAESFACDAVPAQVSKVRAPWHDQPLATAASRSRSAQHSQLHHAKHGHDRELLVREVVPLVRFAQLSVVHSTSLSPKVVNCVRCPSPDHGRHVALRRIACTACEYGHVTTEPMPSIKQADICACARAEPADSTCTLVSMMQNFSQTLSRLWTFRFVSANTKRSLSMMGSSSMTWSTMGAASAALDAERCRTRNCHGLSIPLRLPSFSCRRKDVNLSVPRPCPRSSSAVLLHVPDLVAAERHTLVVLVLAHVLVIASAVVPRARRTAWTCMGTGLVAALVLTTSATSLCSSTKVVSFCDNELPELKYLDPAGSVPRFGLKSAFTVRVFQLARCLWTSCKVTMTSSTLALESSETE